MITNGNSALPKSTYMFFLYKSYKPKIKHNYRILKPMCTYVCVRACVTVINIECNEMKSLLVRSSSRFIQKGQAAHKNHVLHFFLAAGFNQLSFHRREFSREMYSILERKCIVTTGNVLNEHRYYEYNTRKNSVPRFVP